MYDAAQRMKEIMEASQLTTVEKSKLYSDQLNRFLIFKNKTDVSAHYHEAPVQRTLLVSPTPVSVEIQPQVPPTPVPAEIPSPVPTTPKPNFLTPPPTKGERPKLKRNFFHNWVDSADWKESDLAMMKPRGRMRVFPQYIASHYYSQLRFSTNVWRKVVEIHCDFGFVYLVFSKVCFYICIISEPN